MSDTPIADMVELMLSGGIPPDAILMAIRAVEEATSYRREPDPAAARRRAWDREYRRVKRLGHPPERPPDTPEIDSISSLSPITQKDKKKERKSGIVCPPDFHPTEHHFDVGERLGHSRECVLAMAAEMRDWSAANANRAVARKADWNLTFSGWMRRTKPKGGGNGKTPSPITAAVNRALASVTGGGDQAGQAPAGLLPHGRS